MWCCYGQVGRGQVGWCCYEQVGAVLLWAGWCGVARGRGVASIIAIVCRECAKMALDDAKKFLNDEGGQAAVSPLVCVLPRGKH